MHLLFSGGLECQGARVQFNSSCLQVAPVVAPVKKFAVMPKLASFGLGYGYSRPKPVNAVPAVTPSSHLNLDVPLREPSPEPVIAKYS